MSLDIDFHVEAHLGIVTLNRVSALNALTFQMIVSLQKQLSAWNEDAHIHAIVIQSASEKAFCAGGDVRWLYETGKVSHKSQLDFFKHEFQLNLDIHQLKKPYIALMNGLTMGGGVGISLHGSHPVADDDFVFAMPETSIGFFPDIGASALLSRCPDFYGLYLGLTGHRLKAMEAYQLGLVHCLISKDKWSDVLAKLKQMNLSEDAFAQVDDCLQQFSSKIEGDHLRHRQFIREAFNHTEMEDIITALEKGHDEWHQETLKTLMQKSPLSLKVTLLQFLKSKGMSLAQCLQMDEHLVKHFMTDHDFYEGIRALLVDKDKSPNWRPRTLSLVSKAQVDAYFKGL